MVLLTSRKGNGKYIYCPHYIVGLTFLLDTQIWISRFSQHYYLQLREVSPVSLCPTTLGASGTRSCRRGSLSIPLQQCLSSPLSTIGKLSYQSSTSPAMGKTVNSNTTSTTPKGQLVCAVKALSLDGLNQAVWRYGPERMAQMPAKPFSIAIGGNAIGRSFLDFVCLPQVSILMS